MICALCNNGTLACICGRPNAATRRAILWHNIREQTCAYEPPASLTDDALDRILRALGGPVFLADYDALGWPRPDEMEELETLCEDCPPIGYPTDKTRCTPCPRRVATARETPDA
jgi:hypothetical protein